MFVSLLSFPFPIPYMPTSKPTHHPPINQSIHIMFEFVLCLVFIVSFSSYIHSFLSIIVSLSLFISLSLFLRPAYKNNKQTKLNKHCKLSIFSTATLDSLPAYSRRKAENQQTFFNFQSPSAISVQYRCPVSGSGQCQPQAELYQ